MEQITLPSCAKLNLSLDVTARRKDGYHDLCMVMCSVDLHDDVTVALRHDGRVQSESNLPWLPRDGRNLAVKAARAFFSAIGREDLGADLRLEKRVPVGAGMAGGSGNAAAVLRALDLLTGANLGAEALREIGLEVGSDVPYCVSGGTVLARGRGEILTPLPELPACSIVVCKPSFSVSTADLFRRLDGLRLRTHPDTPGLLSALEKGDLPGVARRMYNVFEDALPRSCAEVHSIRGALLDQGALGAVMTGTGSAVFGLFDDPDAGARAREALGKRYPDCWLTHAVSEY